MEKLKSINIALLSSSFFCKNRKPVFNLILKILPFVVALSFLGKIYAFLDFFYLFVHKFIVIKYFLEAIVSEPLAGTMIIIHEAFRIIFKIILFCPLHISIFSFLLKGNSLDTKYYSRLFQRDTIHYGWLMVKFSFLFVFVPFTLLFLLNLTVLSLIPNLSEMLQWTLNLSFLILTSVLAVRVLLAFPAAAIGAVHQGFRWSYKKLKGHTFPVWGTIALIYLLPHFVLEALEKVVIGPIPFGTNTFPLHIIIMGLFDLAGLYLTAFAVATVAHIYQQVVKQK